jgi:hypothetical protein
VAQNPNPFAGVDPQMVVTMKSVARTIVAALLQRLDLPRPHTVDVTIQFARGNTTFKNVHLFADSAAKVAYLFNSVLPDMDSAAATKWMFSPAHDRMSVAFRYSVTVILHPRSLDIATLSEVPPNVRLFVLGQRVPFPVTELVINGLHDLVSGDRALPRLEEEPISLVELRERYGRESLRAGLKLLEAVDAVFKERYPKLNGEVKLAIAGLLTDARQHPSGPHDSLFQAASYLGMDLYGVLTESLKSRKK